MIQTSKRKKNSQKSHFKALFLWKNRGKISIFVEKQKAESRLIIQA